MTLTLELEPELDDTLRALADAEGVSVEQYLRRLISQALKGRSKQAAVGLLQDWESEDATTDPDELARREHDWKEFREAMNRSHSSHRVLYP
jgi:DNA-directed RNA polymerase specialized sigma24 family protein